MKWVMLISIVYYTVFFMYGFMDPYIENKFGYWLVRIQPVYWLGRWIGYWAGSLE
jgi:hypothetical protein